jgi:hypothetical protein
MIEGTPSALPPAPQSAVVVEPEDSLRPPLVALQPVDCDWRAELSIVPPVDMPDCDCRLFVEKFGTCSPTDVPGAVWTLPPPEGPEPLLGRGEVETAAPPVALLLPAPVPEGEPPEEPDETLPPETEPPAPPLPLAEPPPPPLV